MNSNVTFVTGLWDMGRGNLKTFNRSFDHYLKCFEELLSLNINLVVFVPEDLEQFVLQRRSLRNTYIVKRNNQDFYHTFDFYQKVQSIRTNPDWFSQAEWLSESPQARLELYNPVVMSKMFMLHTATIYKNFNTDYYFWIDAGITNTVGKNFLENLNFITGYMQKHCPNKCLFLTYPYTGNNEIHGFERKKLAELCQTDFVDFVPRGGFFGGYCTAIDKLNGNYWSNLNNSLDQGYMGTEESIFCILAHLNKNLIHRYDIGDDGLVWPFFNHLSVYLPKDIKNIPNFSPVRDFDNLKVHLYMLTYNSPDQLQGLLWSFEQTDKTFLTKPKLFLINNSLDRNTDTEYERLCQRYNIKHIKFDNIGICGGRQFAAEHFYQSDADYYLFFEDDMFLFPPSQEVICRSGFRTYIPNLYDISLKIMYSENYDYLKLTYSEFYGTNRYQFAWFNIDDRVRQANFPDNKFVSNDIKQWPETICTSSKKLGDVEYFEGEYHYCNWPSWFNKHGNYKIFIEKPLDHKYEQIWMANCYYMIKDGYLRPAVLGISPVNHNRYIHYHANERKES